MPVIHNFSEFIQAGLICPPGQSKIEFASGEFRGLLVEVRAAATATPTWYLRLKNLRGTNTYRRLGTTRELTYAQAKKLATQIRAEHMVALKSEAITAAPASSAMTLERFFFELYLPHAKLHKRSWGRDLSLFRTRIRARFGQLPLSAIKRLDVMTFQNEIIASGLSAATARHHVVLMRRFLSLAVTWELLEKNVLKGVQLVPLNNVRDVFLTEEETARLVQVLSTDSNRLVCSILLFLLNTGARKMEAMKAKWSDIELTTRMWTIPMELNKAKKPKTIPLGESAMQVLMSLESRGRSEYVFPNPETNLPLTTISKVWYRVRAEAGINPAMRIHDTRACLAQRLLKANASIETVARILGNHPNMAYARYARFSSQTLLSAADAGSIPMPAAVRASGSEKSMVGVDTADAAIGGTDLGHPSQLPRGEAIGAV